MDLLSFASSSLFFGPFFGFRIVPAQRRCCCKSVTPRKMFAPSFEHFCASCVMTMQRAFAVERRPSFSCQKYTTLNRKASIAVIKKQKRQKSVPLWIGVNRIRVCRAKLFRFLFLGIRPRLQAAEPRQRCSVHQRARSATSPHIYCPCCRVRPAFCFSLNTILISIPIRRSRGIGVQADADRLRVTAAPVAPLAQPGRLMSPL